MYFYEAGYGDIAGAGRQLAVTLNDYSL